MSFAGLFDDALRLAGALGLSVLVMGAAAFGAVRWFGEKWINDKFERAMQDHRHKQATELEAHKLEINRAMDRATRLHLREYEAIPEVWELMVKAYYRTEHATRALRLIPGLAQMSKAQRDAFREASSLPAYQWEAILNAADPDRAYSKADDLNALEDAKAACSKAYRRLRKYGIFMPAEVRQRFHLLSDCLWKLAMSQHQVHSTGSSTQLLNEQQQLKERASTALRELEMAVQNRMASASVVKV